ncbi:hypothetical protein HYH03_006455 [Edaphochlamys debaryana]|uniref:Uncharacterized protein n=1 Tax=Edaphochlamys debaryana TaxID=47281 RepID=A0A835Y2X2_9CHLO|nr:hypothetical protein HYH03_006455 [Edaphochlamys debaryana]|eukprot:KAG2495512.1 hypothetical protein HYH03_006455 [Edaphochlamys debaryana]
MVTLRKRKQSASPQSPPSPNQESAVNSRTGKVAFGPWLGPFDTNSEALLSGPLFLADPSGLIRGAPTPQPAVDSGSPKAPAAAGQQLYALVSKAAQREAAAGQARVPPKRVLRERARCGSTMAHHINQPRRG